MVKVKVHAGETPSQEVIRAANTTALVTDARGRKIEIRKLKTLDRMRLFELVGPENAMNDRYLGYATLAYSVVSIDGEQLPRPDQKIALEAIVQRLDEEGFEAVARSFTDSMKKSPSADELKDQVKNG